MVAIARRAVRGAQSPDNEYLLFALDIICIFCPSCQCETSKYISKKLLSRVEEAEHQKYPVSEILKLLLGGLEKCSSKKFDTFSSGEVLAESENIKTTANCSSKNINPPSRKKKRPSGYGGGYIEYREVKRNHKTYSQYWYHYEFWSKGDLITKKSKYISKSKRSRIERMNSEKAPVEEILKVLQNRSKRKK